MHYNVIATIRSGSNDPVEMKYYSGDNLALALSAMARAATGYDETNTWGIPESLRMSNVSVRLDFIIED